MTRSSFVSPAVCFSLLLGATTAYAFPIIDVVPSLTTVDIGESFSVDIRLQDAVDVAQVRVLFGFDPLFLQRTLQSVTPLPGSSFVFQAVNPTTGEVLHDFCCNLFSGAGTIVTIIFLALTAGTTDVTILQTSLIMRTAFGDVPVTPTIQNGTVIISAVPEPGSLLLAGWGLLGALGAGRKIFTRSWPLRRRRHVAA
jgi:hypothetical protein